MTLTEIIAKAAERYPTTRAAANQGKAICDIQRQLFVKLGINKPQFDIWEDSTVADLPSYTLPTNCRIENIVRIVVAKTTSNDDFEDYEYAAQDKIITEGNYYTRGATVGLYDLFKDGAPIPTAGLKIQITYRDRFVEFDGSDLTVVPALDTDYHDYFWMMLIQDNASCGSNPDIDVAKAWRDEADLYFRDIKASILDRLTAAPDMICEAKERM